MIPLLLAEDDKELREKYRKSLEAYGFEVIAIDDGLKLFNIARGFQFKVVVSDTDLPGMDGDKAIEELLKDGMADDICIIAISDELECLEYWKGIAYETRYKRGISSLGKTVSVIYEDFCSGGKVRLKKNSPKYHKRKDGTIIHYEH